MEKAEDTTGSLGQGKNRKKKGSERLKLTSRKRKNEKQGKN